MTWLFTPFRSYPNRSDVPIISQHRVCPQALAEGDVHGYTSQVFKMFNGVPEEMTLVFHDSLIGAVYDRFGEEVEIRRLDGETCSVTVTVQDSPVFRGWLAQFGGQVSIA